MTNLTKQEHDILDRGFNKLKDQAFIQFVKGAEEHGGSLIEKPCHKFKKPELIDLLIYEMFEEEQRNRAIELLERYLKGQDWGCCNISRAINILKFGNEEGKEYHD